MQIRNHFIFEFQLPDFKGNKGNLLQTLLVATVPLPITLIVQTLPQNLSIPSVTVPTVREVAFVPPGTCKKGVCTFAIYMFTIC